MSGTGVRRGSLHVQCPGLVETKDQHLHSSRQHCQALGEGTRLGCRPSRAELLITPPQALVVGCSMGSSTPGRLVWCKGASLLAPEPGMPLAFLGKEAPALVPRSFPLSHPCSRATDTARKSLSLGVHLDRTRLSLRALSGRK